MNNQDEAIRRVASELKIFLKNFYPNKRMSEQKEKELIDKLTTIFNYCVYLKQSMKNGITISQKEIYNELFEKFGLRFNENELKKLINSMSLLTLLDIYQEGELREYIVFMNNLVEVAYFIKKDNELQKIFSSINIPEIMSLNQFMCSKSNETGVFLFKRPFRYTSTSVQKIIEIYSNLSCNVNRHR